MFISITASAQAPFVTYRPAQPNSYSNNYQSMSPFTIYTPAPDPYSNYRQAPQPRSKTYNLTGYYNDGRQWKTMPIKVTITGERVILSAYKVGNNWLSNSGVVNEVGYYDPEVVKEHFNFKANTTYKGTVYF